MVRIYPGAECGGYRWPMLDTLPNADSKTIIGFEVMLKAFDVNLSLSSNPMDFLFHLQPAMVFGMLPLLLYHGYLPFLSTRQLFAAELTHDFVEMAFKIVMGGVLAFALGMTEYLLVAKTSR